MDFRRRRIGDCSRRIARDQGFLRKLRYRCVETVFVFLLTSPATGQLIDIESSAPLEYDFETGQLETKGSIEANYGHYALQAGSLIWDRQEGDAFLDNGVLLRHQPPPEILPSDSEEQIRGPQVYRAWLPTSFQNRSFLILAENVEIEDGGERLLASGRGAVLFNEGRLNAESLTVSRADETLIAETMRGGNGTFFFSGAKVEASQGEARLEDATFYAGIPGPWSPRVHLNHAIVRENGKASLYGATLGIGPVPLLYLPRAWVRNWDFGVSFELDAGFADNLGTYVDAGASFKALPDLTVNPALSYYSKRGTLLSPNFSWNTEWETLDIQTEGTLLSGYINDQGDAELRGVDDFGDPIGRSRGYLHLQAMANRPGGSSFVNQYEFQSDNEVLRDFREGLEDRYFAPESFSEWYIPFGPFSFTALGRFRTMDVRESLDAEPSLQLALNPIPIGETGIVQRGWLGYDRLSLTGENISPDVSTDRFEAVYRLDRRFALNDWLFLTPTAGARWRSYNHSDPAPTSSSRVLYETGFDLYGDFHRSWNIQSRAWEIDELVHRIRPLIGYRWMPVGGSSYESVPQINPPTYLSGTDPLGFAGVENQTSAGALQILRVGAENQILTRRGEDAGGYRELATINVYQGLH